MPRLVLLASWSSTEENHEQVLNIVECIMSAPCALTLPRRTTRPRAVGLTSLLDGGLPLGQFEDHVRSFAPMIDLIKFGWGTAIVDSGVAKKAAIAREHGIRCYLGGTLFEKCLLQDRVDEFGDFVASLGLDTVEISNGTIELSNTDKATWISRFADRFTVISEVGYKDPNRSIHLHPAAWIEFAAEDLAAGASHVTLEARESGMSGISRASGEPRFGLITEILTSDLDQTKLVFEAPTRALQTALLEQVGPNANLANIAFHDIVGLETLRQGLRSDTLVAFEPT